MRGSYTQNPQHRKAARSDAPAPRRAQPGRSLLPSNRHTAQIAEVPIDARQLDEPPQTRQGTSRSLRPLTKKEDKVDHASHPDRHLTTCSRTQGAQCPSHQGFQEGAPFHSIAGVVHRTAPAVMRLRNSASSPAAALVNLAGDFPNGRASASKRACCATSLAGLPPQPGRRPPPRSHSTASSSMSWNSSDQATA